MFYLGRIQVWVLVWDHIKINHLVTVAITPIRFLEKHKGSSIQKWNILKGHIPKPKPSLFCSSGFSSPLHAQAPSREACALCTYTEQPVLFVGGLIRQTALNKSKRTLQPRIIQCWRQAYPIKEKNHMNKEISCIWRTEVTFLRCIISTFREF